MSSESKYEESAEALSSNALNSQAEFRIGSIPEVMRFAGELQQTFRRLNTGIENTKEALANGDKKIADQKKLIDEKVENLKELQEALTVKDAKAVAKLQKQIEVYRADLTMNKADHDRLRKKLEDQQVELASANRQWDTTNKILKFELESATTQLDQAKKALKLRRLMYDHGDANMQDVSNSEERLVSASTRHNQLKQLIEYCSQK